MKEFWGGPYDGLKYNETTGVFSSVDPKTTNIKQEDWMVSQEKDTVTVHGPHGVAKYDQKRVQRKTRWVFRPKSHIAS